MIDTGYLPFKGNNKCKFLYPKILEKDFCVSATAGILARQIYGVMEACGWKIQKYHSIIVEDYGTEDEADVENMSEIFWNALQEAGLEQEIIEYMKHKKVYEELEAVCYYAYQEITVTLYTCDMLSRVLYSAHAIWGKVFPKDEASDIAREFQYINLYGVIDDAAFWCGEKLFFIIVDMAVLDQAEGVVIDVGEQYLNPVIPFHAVELYDCLQKK